MCSTMNVLIVGIEYIEYNLDIEIGKRAKENNYFEEGELW